MHHPDIDKIAFTGSTEVGRIIRRATAGSGKRLSLELGGKSPFVVFDDADLDSVVEGVVDAIWFNQGQVCCAGSRLLVQESIADRLIDKLRARMEKLRVGDPLDKAVDIGAIVAPVQLEKIQQPGQARRGRGRDACGSRPGPARPTAISSRRRSSPTSRPPSTIAQVEIFGPVLVSMTFRTPAEAVALANNTRYGLAASVWSENINLALDVAPQDQGRHRLGQLHQSIRRGLRLRRLPRERLRARRRQRGPYEYVRPAWEERLLHGEQADRWRGGDEQSCRGQWQRAAQAFAGAHRRPWALRRSMATATAPAALSGYRAADD